MITSPLRIILFAYYRIRAACVHLFEMLEYGHSVKHSYTYEGIVYSPTGMSWKAACVVADMYLNKESKSI